ncbi:MAG: sugar ABC transporter permease [Defluviitaleaceae bacterium]|nr:sugar ABC transporter permease [Defluviitaleaceae bacterium]
MEGVENKKIRKYSRDRRIEFFSSLGMLAPYAILFTLFIAVPVVIAIGLSFTVFDAVQRPTFAGMLNYITLLTQDEIFVRHVLPNTFLFSIIVGPGGFILSFMMAWLLSQIQKGPRTVIALIVYAPSMVGGVFVPVIWRMIFSGDRRGLVNAALINWGIVEQPIQFLLSPTWIMPIIILVTLWSSMGIGFLALLAGILNINEEYYEAAYIDGLNNRFQEIVYVTIPNMRPQMLFGAIMSIVGAFTAGAIGVQLTNVNPTPQYAGQLILNHIDDFGLIRFEMGYAAALSVVLLLMIWFFSKLSYSLFGEKPDE